MRPGLVVGALRTTTRTVGDEHTVPRMPGCRFLAEHGLPLLASAALVALVEDAVFELVGPLLEPGEVLVGTRFHLPHEAPAAAGDVLDIAMMCTAIHDAALWWRIRVTTSGQQLADFRHRAVVVPRVVIERRLNRPDAAGTRGDRSPA